MRFIEGRSDHTIVGKIVGLARIEATDIPMSSPVEIATTPMLSRKFGARLVDWKGGRGLRRHYKLRRYTSGEATAACLAALTHCQLACAPLPATAPATRLAYAAGFL